MEDTCCGVLSVLAHCSVLVWLVVLCWRLDNPNHSLSDPVIIAASVLLILSYALLISETINCYALAYVTNYITYQDAMTYFRSQRSAQPNLSLALRYKPSRFKDKKGLGDPTNINAEGKLIVQLPVHRCLDASGDIKGVHPGRYTRVGDMEAIQFHPKEILCD